MARLTKAPVDLSLRIALSVSALLFALRWHLGSVVGFGDAEALYACYALHPQPAYLDHPGLVGAIARWLGGGFAPSPEAAHRFSAFAATALPWVGFAAAHAAGARGSARYRALFALALAPELAVGLFGLTPDLPLAFAWLVCLGAGSLLLSSAPGSRAALLAALVAGFATGAAVTAKASGALLLVAWLTSFRSREGRRHLGTAAPYAGVGVALILAFPVIAWELRESFPMLRHRFVGTQAQAGLSLRNAGALVGGQLLYVTPPFLLAAWGVFRAAVARRRDDAVLDWLLLATVVPFVPLAALCLWSRVAEPHWLAPAYLGLAVAAARVDAVSTRLARVCAGVGVVAAALGWALVATPLYPKLAGSRYVPRYDLVNDLYAWRTAAPLVAEAVEDARGQSREPVVVGPHWTICAQVHAALGPAVRVGCRGPVSDFSRWLPEETWSRTRTLIYVTDDRFPGGEAQEAFPGRDAVGVRTARVYRGGRLVRTVRVVRLERSATAFTPLPWRTEPAPRAPPR